MIGYLNKSKKIRPLADCALFHLKYLVTAYIVDT